MIKLSIFEIVDWVNKGKKRVVIVGAGMLGQYVLAHLKRNGIEVTTFFDNKAECGREIDEVKIMRPTNMGEDYYYIIAVKSDISAQILYKQLLSEGINAEKIIAQEYYPRTYEYRSNLKEEECQKVIDMEYYERFHKLMSWDSPCTYNEIINWEKINVRDERRTRLADKYLVREWIKEQIGEKYLARVYGVWENVEDIDFTALPNRYALKVNNGSGRNIIVTNSEEIDTEEVKKQLKEWMEKNFFIPGLEYQYKNIKPKIICEEYLEGLADTFYDYDVYCFHGEPKYIWCINGSHKADCKAAFYDVDWDKQTFSYGYPLDEEDAPRPRNLEKMLELSRTLARDFEHVRVDWYEYPDSAEGFLFSEMTFSTWGGVMKFVPEEYDAVFGALI